jgi:IS5 family transposase
MLGRSRKNKQMDMFDIPMKKYIDINHEFVSKGDDIDWVKLESDFKSFYSERGRPAISLRKIAGLQILKDRFSISDEKALDIWLENPYWQYFCGEMYFQKDKPFSIGEFSRFRKRVGKKGMGMISHIGEECFGPLQDKTYMTYADRKRRGFWDKFFAR